MQLARTGISFSSFSELVPVPKTSAFSDKNFFTKDPPMPPVAPVIKTFFSFKFIILNFLYHQF